VTTAAECQNCRAPLAGPYCSQCGQKGDVSIPTVGQLLAEVLGDIYSFDSRLWRSLGTLALKPGRLTSSYLAGQHARHTPPFRMYLVMSVVFFVLFSLFGAAYPPVVPAEGTPDAALPDPAATAGQPAAAATAEDGSVHVTFDDDGDVDCNLVDKDTPERLRSRLVAACEKIERDNTSYTRAFADNFPVMMLVFIPIVAAIMRLLYLFARRKYVEHLLFFAHVHTFFFLVAFVTVLLFWVIKLAPFLAWPARIAYLAAWAYFPVYIFLAMRHVYRQGYALTAVKYVVLGGSYFVAFMTTLLVTIIVTAVTI